MIKNFRKVKPPTVDLGNLNLKNCSNDGVVKDPDVYPRVYFARRISPAGLKYWLGMWSPKDCPDEYEIETQYDTPEEVLLDYANDIKREFKDWSDEELKERRFIGTGKEARRKDELSRREIYNK